MIFFRKKEKKRYGRYVAATFFMGDVCKCSGFSREIIKGSFFLETKEPCSVAVGSKGTVSIDMGEDVDNKEFPCKVIKRTSGGVELEYYGRDAYAFFRGYIVKDTSCYDCGAEVDLQQCPECKGINTICVACLTRGEGMCRDCKSTRLMFASKEIPDDERKQKKRRLKKI